MCCRGVLGVSGRILTYDVPKGLWTYSSPKRCDSRLSRSMTWLLLIQEVFPGQKMQPEVHDLLKIRLQLLQKELAADHPHHLLVNVPFQVTWNRQ